MRLLITISLLCFAGLLMAQQTEEKRIIQFTGVVFSPDSTSVVPGVHVYVPAAGRGTTTNPYGFFSMAVLEGDSVVFSSVGFLKQYYIVPTHDSDRSLKLLVTLQEDVTFLSEVEVFPYPSEAMFKKAILAMEFPDQRNYDNMNAWMTDDYMRTAYRDLPNSPNANHQYFMELQRQSMQNRYQMPANNLLNPWAWARFIQSIKQGN